MCDGQIAHLSALDASMANCNPRFYKQYNTCFAGPEAGILNDADSCSVFVTWNAKPREECK